MPSTRAPSIRSFIRFRQRRNVVLPQPDGPIRAVISLRRIDSVRRGPPGTTRNRPTRRERRARRHGSRRSRHVVLIDVEMDRLLRRHVGRRFQLAVHLLTISAHNDSSARSPPRSSDQDEHHDEYRGGREVRKSCCGCLSTRRSPRSARVRLREELVEDATGRREEAVTAPTSNSGAVSPKAERGTARARQDAGRRVRQDVASDDLPLRRPDAVCGLADAVGPPAAPRTS